ncbi:MAG: cytidylate kinase-like family protein [Ignavibacteriaceae bacterium]
MNIITISRGSLSATEMLARKVSEKLNCSVVTREDVIKAAEKYGIKETGLGDLSFIEKSPTIWDKMSDRKKHYLSCFQTALLDFALKGSVIYHGHLAQFLLGDIPFVLRTLLTTPTEYRIKTLMKEGGKSREQVTAYIKLIDERREKWSHFLYGADWKNPSHYDIVLNLEKISIDLAADLLSNIASKKEFQSSPESLKIIKNLHLSAKAKVYLQQSPRTKGSEVEIEADADSGSLVVKGNTPRVGSRMWENDIKNVLSKVEGVKTIKVIKSIVGYYE